MKYTSRFLGKEQIAEGTMAFHFEKPQGFEHRAGQHADFELSSKPEAGIYAFSIASAPHEKDLTIATRLTGSPFKNTLLETPPGYPITIDGPRGSFVLHENVARPAVILVGGIGITPFISMLRDAVHRKLPHQVHLFFSNRLPQDAPFLDELLEITKSVPTIHVIPTMTEVKDGDSWQGEKGYITLSMIEKHFPMRDNALYYMAGPQQMVEAMRNLVETSGVSRDDIKTEEFSGY